MAKRQVRDVIHAAGAFHRKLADVYQRMSDEAGKERLKMLLHYMSRHEKNLDECLLKYEREGSRRALDSWLTTSAGAEIPIPLEGLTFEPYATAGEIIDAALRVDARLVDFYKRVADDAAHEEVKSLFSALFEMEKKSESALVRDAIELEDD